MKKINTEIRNFRIDFNRTRYTKTSLANTFV